MGKLLIERADEPLEMICEADGSGEKNYWLKGIFLQANIKNKNGRVYDQHVLKDAVEKYIDEYVSTNRAMGQLDHPDVPSVQLPLVSHLVTELKEDGSNWIGKAKLLPGVPNGKIAIGLVKGGVKLGVSSRGVGSLVMENGVNKVQRDYRISAIDIVADPSAPAALVDSLMENADWIFDAAAGDYKLVEDIQKNLRQKFNEDTLFEAFKNFVTKLV